MSLAGIELRYLVDAIAEQSRGYYVSNIYGVTRDSVLFKLHHSDKPDIFLMIAPFGIWVTESRMDSAEQNKMVRRLRSDLLRLRVFKIEQVGRDRVARITFEGFDRKFVLVAEFFGGGNIILCSEEMKILALLHSLEVRHRTLRVGADYVPPPQSGLDIFNLTQEQIGAIAKAEAGCSRWIGKNLGLPSRYAEEMLRRAHVDPAAPCGELTEQECAAIFHAVRSVADKVCSGEHDPVIIRDGEPVASPIKIQDGKESEEAPSFAKALDAVFTEKMLEEARRSKTAPDDQKIAQLKNQLEEQSRAIDMVQERALLISGAARLLQQLAAEGFASLHSAKDRLEAAGAALLAEKGSTILKILDQKIRVDDDASLYATASVLFDEAKKQAGAVPSIEKQKRRTEHDLSRLQNREQHVRQSVGSSEIRKKNWFERYRWFVTSDGKLAIGGRDSSSNSSIIRKHVGQDDRVFHAEIFGSPFFVLKDCPEDLPASLSEVAYATVCFSRAWREAMYGMSAYWVYPPQVKKAAPTGQFLPRGSFSIDGRRNFIRVPSLKLCIGVLKRDGAYLLQCGPAGSAGSLLWHAVIEPGGSESSNTAKRLRAEFIRINEVSSTFTVDDFLRVLPAGKSHIVKMETRP